MTDIDELKTLKEIIRKDIKEIPEFINKFDSFHMRNKLAYNNIRVQLQDIIRILMKLTNNKILDDITIKNYHTLIQDHINYALENVDDIIMMETTHYLIETINKYEQEAFDLELYRVYGNFKKFKENNFLI